MKKITKIPKVNKIKIEDYGIIKNADIEFSDGLNIIVGPSASGKTTVIKFLIEMFHQNLSSGEKLIQQVDEILDDTAILMDGVLERLRKEDRIKVLEKLAKSGRRVILTLNEPDLSEIRDEIKANIIDTKNFELNEDG